MPKSALEATEKLYTRIKADSQNPNREGHLIKAILFIGKYQSRLNEDGLVKAIAQFELEMNAATGVTKAVLQSMLAEMYDQYLLNNMYKFSSRTTTDDSFKQDDIRTWDIRRITNESYKLYKASISNEATKTVPTKSYEAVLDYYKNDSYLQLSPSMTYC